MRFRWPLVAALLAAPVGCRAKDEPAPAASARVADAPAPASLLGELSLGNPKETWRRLRLLGGDMAQALPSSLPVLLATSLSLPPSAAGSLDESLPMVGVLLSRQGTTEPDAVLGMHVLSGAELVASLTLGNAAKFRRLELSPGLVRLLPAPGAPEFNGALGVYGNYLLLATRLEALRDAGRFVAEVVPKRARSEPGFTLRTSEKVLSGSLAHALRDAWQARRASLSAREQAEREAKGRAPDFADPEVLLAGIDSTVESWLGVLESSRELSLSLVPHGDRLLAELTLLPASEGAAALLHREVVVGSLAPLLQLPASARAGLLVRGDDPSRPDSGQGVGASLARLFGERLKPEQSDKLVKALDALSRSRRGASVLGLVATPTPALVITCEVADTEAFSAAVADVLRLVELGPVSSWLTSSVGKPTLLLSRGPAGSQRAQLRFQRGQRGVTLPVPAQLYVSWQARDGVGSVVIASDASVGLAPLSEPNRLSTSNWLSAGQARLADRAALALFLDARLFGPGGPESAPLLAAFGTQGERIVVSVEAAPAALRAVSTLFALDRSP